MSPILFSPLVRWLTIASSAIFALSACTKHSSDQAGSENQSPPPVETVVFGVYTADKASKVVEQFAPILSDLETSISKKLGRPIKIQMRVSADYSTGVEDLVEGRVHFSRLGPASFITAKEMNPQLELLAMESKSGSRTFKGIIAVHSDSPVANLSELKGMSFAFGDPRSTIGRYLAQAELLKAGIRSSDFETVDFLGRHDTVGMAVAAQEFTAGALKESTFNSLVESGQPLRELTSFDNVTKPWVSHPSLTPEIAKALRDTFLELHGSGVSKDGFLPAEESHYDSIKTAMNQAQSF